MSSFDPETAFEFARSYEIEANATDSEPDTVSLTEAVSDILPSRLLVVCEGSDFGNFTFADNERGSHIPEIRPDHKPVTGGYFRGFMSRHELIVDPSTGIEVGRVSIGALLQGTNDSKYGIFAPVSSSTVRDVDNLASSNETLDSIAVALRDENGPNMQRVAKLIAESYPDMYRREIMRLMIQATVKPSDIWQAVYSNFEIFINQGDVRANSYYWPVGYLINPGDVFALATINSFRSFLVVSKDPSNGDHQWLVEVCQDSGFEAK